MRRVVAGARFLVERYVRSRRVLYVLVAVAAVEVVTFGPPPGGRGTATGSLADAAAFLVPFGAWAARALLDTEPDVQRDLSVLAAGSRWAHALSGLLAGYVVTLGLGVLLLALPLVQGAEIGLGPGTLAAGAALVALAAGPAAAFGAWTSRAVLPSTAASVLLLIGGLVVLLAVSTGPAEWLSIPMAGWVRSAQEGPAAFGRALPGIALQAAVWTAVVGGGYVLRARAGEDPGIRIFS